MGPACVTPHDPINPRLARPAMTTAAADGAGWRLAWTQSESPRLSGHCLFTGMHSQQRLARCMRSEGCRLAWSSLSPVTTPISAREANARDSGMWC
jgi:hypothetical protein